MNREKVKKSLSSNDKKGNLKIAGCVPNHDDRGSLIKADSSVTEEAVTKVDDKPINLNEFLDFIKVSCHVNDMVNSNDDDQQKQKRNTTSVISADTRATNAIDFDELIENRLVNDLFGFKKAQPETQQKQHRLTRGLAHDEDFTDSVTSNSTTDRSGRMRKHYSFSSTVSNSIGYARHNSGRKCEASKNTAGVELHPKLGEKLDYVINEGVLDSVLPFICPVPLPTTFTSRSKQKPKEIQSKTTSGNHNTVIEAVNEQTKSLETPPAVAAVPSGKDIEKPAATRRKSFLNTKALHTSSVRELREPEVLIHVCDEVKNTARDFTCSQRLLVNKMGYFADVTAGQKLEDMDISVHCDIQIFDWLMKWVKRSGEAEKSSELSSDGTLVSSTSLQVDAGPQLDAGNVVPILVSASFLQMEPLLLDCLSFCHSRLSEVVRSSTNLSCLNDNIVTRLSAMFTNVELEMVRDKKERVTPRLWTKLIQSLCEPETEALRGHYYSLAGLFRCGKCGKCLTNTLKSYMSCLPNNIRLNRWGQIVNHHIRDSSWDVNTYIVHLFKELKSWRKVYWKLWGHCHFLYCCLCEMHFPVYQMSWCRYHSESPNFLGPITEGHIAGPAGRYPCCGQQAFRYETLPGPNGCQFREHSVLVETDRERAILTIVQLVVENYALCELPLVTMQQKIASGDIEPTWTGLSLTPQRCRQGLLPVLNPEECNAKITRRARQGLNYFTESTSETDTSESLEDIRRGGAARRYRRVSNAAAASCSGYSTSSSGDGCESDYSAFPKRTFSKKKEKKRQMEVPGRYWSGELSARSNQDHQREFEEKVMKQVVAIVNKKNGSEHSLTQNVQPAGGSYVRLEAEWREQLKQRHHHANTVTLNSNSNNNNVNNNSNTALGGKQRYK